LTGPGANKMPERIDLKITFDCNNKCDFCAQGDKRNYHEPARSRKIFLELEKAARNGLDSVVFTGGEPTLHPELETFVRKARECGFGVIQLQTNGQSLSDLSFLKRLKKAGLTEVSPALHGSDPSTHDRLTRNEGSFLRTLAGISNCVKLGLPVISNTVINSLNYMQAPEIAAILLKLGVSQFQFAFVHVVGTALRNRDWIVPKKTEALPYIKKGLDLGRKAGVPCYTEAVPFCLMKGYEDCVAERIIPDHYIVDAGFIVKNYGEHRRKHGKAKRKECSACKYFAVCEGPWKEYPGIYGWEEFVPVKKKRRV